MGQESRDIITWNPGKEISKEITLEILIRHRDALKQARTGELVGVPLEKLKNTERKINQVRGLNLIISAQREMITVSRPIIFFRSTYIWKKKTKEKDREENKFEYFECDYKKLKEWLNFLSLCEKEIIKAERTKRLDDDFLTKKQSQTGEETLFLTDNFHEMIEDLETSYEQIYLLMLTNKIVSAGIEEDEEMEYKELEKEAIRRVTEA